MCVRKHKKGLYKNKRILIFSDRQAVLKALSSPKVTSEVVAECLDALSALASLNEVTLAWVPGHRGIPGNEEADKLARQASAMPLLGPEPALGIPKCSAREAINTFTAIVDLSRFNNSCLKSPASTLVDLIFQSRSFSLNQLTCHCRLETYTAASVYLAEVIFIPFIVYNAYNAI